MTKRVYEAAKEYGVPAKTVIKTLADHHIKAGNFTGIDANMKSILDASFKKGAKGEAQRGHKQENKQTGEGTSRTELLRAPRARTRAIVRRTIKAAATAARAARVSRATTSAPSILVIPRAAMTTAVATRTSAAARITAITTRITAATVPIRCCPMS